MRKITYFALAIAFLFVGKANAQQKYYDDAGREVKRCEAMEAHERLRQRDPKVESLDQFEQWLQPKIREYEASVQNGTRGTNAVTVIPVVFHIIHNGESVGSGQNISANYVNAQLTQLNNDFRRKVGTSGYSSDSRSADTEVEFCLATVDPNGATLSEPGINRINRSSKGWTAPPYGGCSGGNFDDTYIENTIKPNSQWNPNNYLNIWVMNMTCGILGYAQFPSSSGLSGLSSNGGSASTDGVVLLYTSIGSTTTGYPGGSPYNLGRTATHEVGHWLGLRHIWGDANCGTDYCGDTPTCQGPASGCPNKTTCDGVRDMVENYMDYSYDNCMNIFTTNQKTRMQTVLANSPRRSTLGASPACGGGVTPPAGCTATVSTFPYSESFESSFGQWTNATGDNFDWTRRSGTTPSSGTGPSGAFSGSYYAYIESSSPNYPSKTAILASPCFNLSGASTATMTFNYNMYGASMGTLSLQGKLSSSSTWTTLWTQSGNKGTAWQAATVSLTSYAGSTAQLRFVGTTSTSYTSDAAIDNIAISTSGGGGGGCATLNLTMVFDNYPEETSWEVRNSGNTIVASGGTYGSQADGSTRVESMCLNDGCYTLIMKDTYGDGMCCSYGNGSYNLRNSQGTSKASGGSFGSSISHSFCVSGGLRDASAEANIQFEDELSLYPNPTQGQLNIVFTSAEAQNAQLIVVDPVGRIVQQLDWSMQAGLNSRQISLTDAAAGTYLLMVTHGDQRITKRFVVMD